MNISLSSLRILLIGVCLLGVPATSLRAQTTSLRNDTQTWTEVQVAKAINRKTDVVLLGIVRVGRDVSRPVNERIGAGISFKLGKYLTVFPFYLHVASQPTKLNHSTEERINLEATVRFPFGKLVFIDRNRVEFHFHSPPPNFTQYRNRMQLEHELGFGGLRGFIADEVFYDSIASAWIRNRMSVGIIKKVNKHFTLEAYYLRQNDGHALPGDIHAIGSIFKIHL